MKDAKRVTSYILDWIVQGKPLKTGILKQIFGTVDNYVRCFVFNIAVKLHVIYQTINCQQKNL